MSHELQAMGYEIDKKDLLVFLMAHSSRLITRNGAPQ